ncbi:31277_t:CDS:2 [Gigaspora margarita]|uniref:threonine--tRNA ligase n=1 Tax=Gigaspora margarita TaxID=4874 RepID=A0ABM8W1D3_GIGMA|nr:31277_t:CDS:2 [Gigaspora margarita]
MGNRQSTPEAPAEKKKQKPIMKDQEEITTNGISDSDNQNNLTHQCDLPPHHCECHQRKTEVEKCSHRNPQGQCPQCNLAASFSYSLSDFPEITLKGKENTDTLAECREFSKRESEPKVEIAGSQPENCSVELSKKIEKLGKKKKRKKRLKVVCEDVVPFTIIEEKDRSQHHNAVMDKSEEPELHEPSLKKSERTENNSQTFPKKKQDYPIIIRNQIQKFLQRKQKELNFREVITPILGGENLYETSGHLKHYRDYMFPSLNRNNETFRLRPMTCPHHCLIYQQQLRSYRDLPFRLCENSLLYRYEASGALKGLERARWMELADHHVFVNPEQLKEELKKNYRYIIGILSAFDFSTSRLTLTELGMNYVVLKGEAAFYGPKLDFEVETADGKNITLATIQLDFVLPQKFGLNYVDKDQKLKTPIRTTILTDKSLNYRIRQAYKTKIPCYLVIGQEEIKTRKLKLIFTYLPDNHHGKMKELTEKELVEKLEAEKD